MRTELLAKVLQIVSPLTEKKVWIVFFIFVLFFFLPTIRMDEFNI